MFVGCRWSWLLAGLYIGVAALIAYRAVPNFVEIYDLLSVDKTERPIIASAHVSVWLSISLLIGLALIGKDSVLSPINIRRVNVIAVLLLVAIFFGIGFVLLRSVLD